MCVYTRQARTNLQHFIIEKEPIMGNRDRPKKEQKKPKQPPKPTKVGA